MKRAISDFFYDHETCAVTALLLGVFVLVGLLIGLCWLSFLPLAYAECTNTADVMGVDYEWRVLGGCFLELDGEMLPEDRWYYLRFGMPPKGG